MAFSVQMPALGESVTEGTVTRWLKEEGDTVEADEPLLEVSTDKVDTEIPAPASGVLIKIVAQEDDVVEIGGELALIGDASESAAPAPAPAPAAEEPAAAAPAAEPEPAAAAAPASAAEGTEVVMPALGESVTEGTVTNWLKAVGDEVSADEPLLEVSTDKVDTEIPAPASGTLLAIFAQEDDVVEVGGKLAIIGDASAAPAPAAPAPAPEPEPEPEPVAATPAPAPTESATVVKADPPTIESTPYVTPLVRKLAADNSLDLNSIKGTGVGGRIRKQDVLAAAEAAKAPEPAPAAPAPAAPAPAASAPATSAPAAAEVRPELAALRGTTQKANRIRLITAKKTRESLHESAQLTQVFEVDMTKIVTLRKAAKESFKASEGVNLTFLPFIAKAVVEALKAHPNVNASIDEGAKEITYYGNVHLGIAVDTDQGLLSPVIHNADDLSIAGLARAIADIAARARTGGLKPDELAGGTFTITNIGSQGALFDTPILVPPQAAMLGTGAIVKRPVVVTEPDGSDVIAIRSMSYLPLTYDHRLIDGADAGRFLTTVKKRLEGGSFAADLGL
ncbi:2-oxoglutarate dehydrogenase, E2 component, dihydrolipoamide succinyltransferase [Gordonia sp. (in: high G+C Gram-positive bacteria)]|jgi:2-oxoglutarate dehydrogenase E2 component (dihydrolipoamide succinyltransferase)|uniref:2-oxoglutarate dehydrogenase, E2 component, dihydrolipoamide succinyltransferase n=1 Tax=Gordonia sp. (in: high G+C Gram-positive bacteria) TaxID=84139 RepID=UPI0026292D4E|nr:2-oxoglutarate dehydrogenase, E2 component, dihydrolipoamide succinyltransferase [Gordonia sp. (in: high G+C Gram-positive bacteria)]HMS76931.1 2-oxoglutarate dehydrogenase, E2 component, dihydrolipoamide succinyltransferase [Gordonia sp. (in: high G+C Gram-positive bacteria)]